MTQPRSIHLKIANAIKTPPAIVSIIPPLSPLVYNGKLSFLKKIGLFLAFATVSTISFAASGTGVTASPQGPNNAVQFNNNHVFGGTGTVTMNPTTNVLTIGATTVFSNANLTQWTNVSTFTFGTGTILRIEDVTPGYCLQTDAFGDVVSSTQGPCGTGSGGGGTGFNIYPASGTIIAPSIIASSFTSTGSGAGSLTLKDSSGNFFTAIKASDTIATSSTYVLPDSTGTVGSKALTRGQTNADGSISTYWGTASDPNAAILTATQTFSGTNTFGQSTNFTNISSTTFTSVTSMTFTNVGVSIFSGSTLTLNSPLSLNGSFGTAGQVPTSNGAGAALTWGAGGGGGGGGGYNMEPATVTIQATQAGIIASTLNVTGPSSLSTTTFGGLSTFNQSATFANISSTTFNNVASMTFTNAGLALLSGSTLTVNGSLVANNDYGIAGQFMQSNGQGNPPSWTAISGSAGGGGVNSGGAGQVAYYAVVGTTVSGSPNIIINTSSVTVVSSITVQQLLTGTTIQATRIQRSGSSNERLDFASGSITLKVGGNTNTDFNASTVFASADNVVHGRTVHDLGNVNSVGGQAGVGVDNATALQNLYPYAAYEASINGDGLGLNQGFFGVKSKTAEDTFFFVSAGTNTSCGVSCFYNNPSTPTFTVNITPSSTDYGVAAAVEFDGILSATPQTLTQLRALAPKKAGLAYYCSDCVTDGIVQSTGTAAGSFAKMNDKTLVIQ